GLTATSHRVLALGMVAGLATGRATLGRVAGQGLGTGRCVLEDVGPADVAGGVGPREVRGQGGKKDRAPGGDWGRDGPDPVWWLGETLIAEGLNGVVGQGAEPVQPRRNPGTTVVHRGVGEGQPARDVVLRFDVGVAVVLVPRETPGLFWLL